MFFYFLSFFYSLFFGRTNNALGITNTIAQDESRWVCNGVFYGLRSMSKAHVCFYQCQFLGAGVDPPRGLILLTAWLQPQPSLRVDLSLLQRDRLAI